MNNFDFNTSNNSKVEIYKAIMESVSEEVKRAINEDIVISANMRDEDPNINNDLVITLKDRLKSGQVKFSFRKKNKRLRRARGTVNIDVIREVIPDFEWDKHYNPMKLNNPYVVRYFDLDKQAWRSCDVDRLLIIIED